MKYQDYGVDDFIKDNFFVEWVSNPNSKSNEFWAKWMASHPEQVPTIMQAQQFITSLGYDDYEELREDEYIEMFENVLRQKPKASPVFNGSLTTNFWVKIAASVTIILTSLLAYSWFAQKAENTTLHQKVVRYSKTNPIGQKTLITLPDGSKIKLNSGSTLSYDSRFGVKNRLVELHGEAFFDITRDPSSPFIIKSGELTTKVLGTSFNVRYYKGEDKIQVLVVKGEVAVSDNLGSSFILNPKDILEYSHTDKNVTKSVCADMQSIIGWKDGILSFSNASFREVVEKIHRWYGVEVVVEDGFTVKGSYTGEYRNKSLEKVMDGISYASGFNYKIINDDKILIYKKP